MRRMLAVSCAFVLAIMAIPSAPASANPNVDAGFFVLQPLKADTARTRFPQADRSLETPRKAIPLKPGAGSGGGKPGRGADGALQTTTTAATSAVTTPGVNVAGVGVGLGSYSDCCTPPDTNLAVGATEVVQWVNLDFAVFDKAGNLLAGPTPGNAIWAGFGGGCEVNNDGDPIVKYDAQNQRWIMTQFSVTTQPYLQCVAVSSGPSFLTSTWHRYAYSFGTSFPDYPKVGVWPDGYYFSFNMFRNGATFQGAAACALDGAAARAGGTSATMICYQFGTAVASLLPGDLDGANGAAGATAAPPPGAAGIFANFGSSALNIWRLHPDYTTTANSTLSAATTLATAAFSTACGGGTCVPQAGTSQKLDSLGDRLMYRLAYRNFGSYESLTVTHSVKGSGTAAPRWYELRNAGTGWTIAQQSSYAPDATYRWMASGAQDKLGNYAIGYSASSTGISPQIRYTGRLATDPASTLRSEVTVALPSTGSNTGPYSRWGDYSSMTLDPANDCTFWYTTMYYRANGNSFTWSTHITSFTFNACQ